MIRDSYMNLNGYWDYAFTKEFRIPEKYDGKILVPFSPESVLSGVSRQLQPDEYFWYRRCFFIPGWRKENKSADSFCISARWIRRARST